MQSTLGKIERQTRLVSQKNVNAAKEKGVSFKSGCLCQALPWLGQSHAPLQYTPYALNDISLARAPLDFSLLWVITVGGQPGFAACHWSPVDSQYQGSS